MSAPWITLYGCRDKLTGKPVKWEKAHPAQHLMWDWDVSPIGDINTTIPPAYLLTRDQACRVMFELSEEPADSIVPVWESFRVIPNGPDQKFMIAKIVKPNGEVLSIHGPFNQNQKMADMVHLYYGLGKGDQVVFVLVEGEVNHVQT